MAICSPARCARTEPAPSQRTVLQDSVFTEAPVLTGKDGADVMAGGVVVGTDCAGTLCEDTTGTVRGSSAGERAAPAAGFPG